MATVVTADLVTDLASPPDVTQSFFHRVMLERAQYRNLFARWARVYGLPRNAGRNIVLRRYTHLAAQISALTEGVPPSGKTPALDDFTANLAQYGDFIAISDFARFTQQDPILTEWTELLGEQAGYSVDMIKRNVADAGTTVVYSNGTARTDVTTVLDPNDLDRAVRTLMNNGAQTYLAGNDGSTTVGSAPTMPAFPCVVHPFTYFTIQNFGTKFRSAEQYRGATEQEYGRYGMLALFVAHDADGLGAGSRVRAAAGGASVAVRNTGGTADVYESMVFARDGFSSVNLDGVSMRTYMKPVGSAGSLDPLDQVGTIGWKTTTTQLITNQAWVLRLEHAAEL